MGSVVLVKAMYGEPLPGSDTASILVSAWFFPAGGEVIPDDDDGLKEGLPADSWDPVQLATLVRHVRFHAGNCTLAVEAHAYCLAL